MKINRIIFGNLSHFKVKKAKENFSDNLAQNILEF